MALTLQACKSAPSRCAVCYAPAKVNLTLAVGEQRPDGYHEIDTVMAAVTLVDEVAVIDSDVPGVSVECNRDDIPSGAENLVYRATEAMARHAGVEPAIRICLLKRIPPGSGLGGGSSDAAAVIKTLDHLWGLNWPTSRLAQIGGEIGSDVPFFFYMPVARCRGRGERVERLADIPGFWAVLVLPDLHLSTSQVYQAFDAEPDLRPDGRLDWPQGVPPIGMNDRLFNALAGAAVRVAAKLGALWGQIEAHSGTVLRLSGSGSALFSLRNDRADAEQAACSISHRFGVRTEAVRCCFW